MKKIREWYPRRLREAGGLSPDFLKAYAIERKLLLGKGLKKEAVDKWISKAITFEKFED
jgi:hypothetical protein